MNEFTLVAGGLAVLVVLVILVKFGKTIINTLALAGLLGLVGLGALVYLRATDGPGQAVAIPQQPADVVQQIAPAATPEPTATPEPSSWLGKAAGTIADVAAVARVLKPERSEVAIVPTPIVIREPQQSGSGVLGTFCAGAFGAVAVGALGVAGWFYWQWQQGGDPHPFFSRRQEAIERHQRQGQGQTLRTIPRETAPMYWEARGYYDDEEDDDFLGGELWSDAWYF
jgi:hypothetical protein